MATMSVYEVQLTRVDGTFGVDLTTHQTAGGGECAVLVEAVDEGGEAAEMGVVPGDELVAIGAVEVAGRGIAGVEEALSEIERLSREQGQAVFTWRLQGHVELDDHVEQLRDMESQFVQALARSSSLDAAGRAEAERSLAEVRAEISLCTSAGPPDAAADLADLAEPPPLPTAQKARRGGRPEAAAAEPASASAADESAAGLLDAVDVSPSDTTEFLEMESLAAEQVKRAASAPGPAAAAAPAPLPEEDAAALEDARACGADALRLAHRLQVLATRSTGGAQRSAALQAFTALGAELTPALLHLAQLAEQLGAAPSVPPTAALSTAAQRGGEAAAGSPRRRPEPCAAAASAVPRPAAPPISSISLTPLSSADAAPVLQMSSDESDAEVVLGRRRFGLPNDPKIPREHVRLFRKAASPDEAGDTGVWALQTLGKITALVERGLGLKGKQTVPRAPDGSLVRTPATPRRTSAAPPDRVRMLSRLFVTETFCTSERKTTLTRCGSPSGSRPGRRDVLRPLPPNQSRMSRRLRRPKARRNRERSHAPRSARRPKRSRARRWLRMVTQQRLLRRQPGRRGRSQRGSRAGRAQPSPAGCPSSKRHGGGF